MQNQKKTNGSPGLSGQSAQKPVEAVKRLEPVDAYQQMPIEKPAKYINAMDRIIRIIRRMKKIVVLKTVLVCTVPK